MKRSLAQAGNVIVPALMLIVVLSSAAVAVLARSMNAYRHVSHVASWQEALLAAESGSDMTMAELRRSLFEPANAFPSSMWTEYAADGTKLPHRGLRFTSPELVHGGEGNTKLNMSVIIDAPPSLRDGSDRQWYRIRSTGTTELPGAAYLTTDKRDHPLRRLSFIHDQRTGKKVDHPITSRYIEVLVKPASFDNAITSERPINLNSHKITVDSYDSRYSTSSTNGLYDPNKWRKNGDIATNSTLIEAGNATIWGKAYTNDGLIRGSANIKGEQRNDYYQELLPIAKPGTLELSGYSLLSDSSAAWGAIDPGITSITTSTTIKGGTKESPKRVKVSQVSLASQTLTIEPTTPGVEGYVEIWVTGDLKATGNGGVVIRHHANLKMFIEGSIDIKGNGTFNAPLWDTAGNLLGGGIPVRFQLLGIKPAAGVPTMNFAGNGNFVGAVYAPNHDAVFGATGSAGTYWGSLTARTIQMGGETVIHYDEALADAGHITDYRIKSWFEDNL